MVKNYILLKEGLWIYSFILFLLGGSCIWLIYDFLYFYKSEYSIHKIFGLPDNIWRFLCVVFFCVGIFFIIFFYSAFSKLGMNSDTISLYYLKPRPVAIFNKSLIKSYKIELSKASNSTLIIYLKDNRKYKAAAVGPEEKDSDGLNQLKQLTAELDRIIQENKDRDGPHSPK